MVSILKRGMGRRREALRPVESVRQGRALKDSELDQVVGGLGLAMVGPLTPPLQAIAARSNLSAGSLVGPFGLFPSAVVQGPRAVGAGTPSGAFSAFAGGGSDRGEP